MRGKQIVRTLCIVLMGIIGALLLLSLFGTAAHAAGLVDDTVDAGNEYSKYALENYQLDFFVDSSWEWLPWNWTDGIGKGIQYALYAITNFIWTVSLYISNATGYVVQEAYRLDFISDTAKAIGENLQTLAGVTQNGFSGEGFYVGFLLLLILVLGVYVAYTGLFKRETAKAMSAALNFVVIFILSASFIAFAPEYITKINGFSADVSNAALTLGTKIVLPNSESEGKDSVDLIRDSLFAIQVKQPWMLLQYGTSDLDTLGIDRVENLLSAKPDTDEREDIVKEEIEDKDNGNLTITKTMSRMGTVVFLFCFNIGISIFIFLLTGMMIFSQVLFILFAMFLPVSFLLSMIPSSGSMTKQALMKLFNTIMMRAGLTLIITAAFSVSTMFYSLSAGYPFFLVAFLQIVTFAGIYFKLGDIMGMFKLQSGDSQQMGRKLLRRPYLFLNSRARRMERHIGRSVRTGAATVTTGAAAGAAAATLFSSGRSGRKPNKVRPATAQAPAPDANVGKRAGTRLGAVLDSKNHIRDKAREAGETVRDTPTQARYAVHSCVSQIKTNVADFKRGIVDEQTSRQQIRTDRQNQRRQTVAQKRMELEHANGNTEFVTKAAAHPKGAVPSNHERPAVKPMPRNKPPTVKAASPVPAGQERPAIANDTARVQTVRSSAARKEPATGKAATGYGASSREPIQRGNGQTSSQRITYSTYDQKRTNQKQQATNIRKPTTPKKGSRK